MLGLLNSSRGRLLDSGGLLGCLGLVLLLDDVAENVVQDEIAVGLSGENESLGELLVGGRLVGNLADNLDDNVVIRGLRIDIGDANLALGEVKFLDALVDGLIAGSVPRRFYARTSIWKTYPLSHAHFDLLRLVSGDEL